MKKALSLLLALVLCLGLLPAAIGPALADNITKPKLQNVSVTVTDVREGTMQAEGFGEMQGTIVSFSASFDRVDWATAHFCAALRRNAPGSNYAYDKMASGTMPSVITNRGEAPRFEEGATGPNGEKITQNGNVITLEKKVCINNANSPDTPAQKYGAYQQGENIVVEISAWAIADNGDAWNAENTFIEIPGNAITKGRTFRDSSDCAHDKWHWENDDENHWKVCDNCGQSLTEPEAHYIISALIGCEACQYGMVTGLAINQVNVTEIPDQTYTGKAIKPVPEVTCEVTDAAGVKQTVTLPENYYTVEYSNNVNVGTGKVILRGVKGLSTGKKTKKFRIVPGTRTVTFKANGGKGSMKALKVKAGSKTTLPKNAFTRSKYAFVKWSTKKDGTGTAYKDGAKITVDDDTTLFAHWAQITLKMVKIESIKRGRKLVLRATVKAGERPLRGVEVSFKFNGRIYTASTSINGIATLAIKAAATKKLTAGKNYTIIANCNGVSDKQTARASK